MTGSQVETGAPLVRLEPVEDDAGDEQAAAGRDRRPTLDLPAPAAAASAEERAARARADVCRDPAGLRHRPAATRAPRIADYLAARDELGPPATTWCADEIELLGLFADLAELSRNRPAGEELHTELRVHSSREHFHTYLQSLDVERGGLPDAVPRPARRGCSRTTASPTLDRTPELEEAVFRIFLAQQRSAPDVHLATELLQRWIAEPPPTEELAGPARDLLERLVRATQLRFPVVGDLARSIRFRWFDQPLVDDERVSVLAGVRDEVAALAADPDAPDRAAADRRAGRDPGADRPVPRRAARGAACPSSEPMLEVLVRRHYREYDLHDLRVGARARTAPFAVADYTLDDRPDPAGLDRSAPSPSSPTRPARSPPRSAPRSPPATRATRPWSTSTCTGPTRRSRRSAATEELARIVGALPFAADVRRIAVAVVPGRGPAGRLLHLPPASPTGGVGRGRPGPRRAPDGRPPAQPVAAARLRRHPHRGARGRAALRVRRPGEPRRPAAGRAGAGAPARRRTRRRRAGSSACRTPSERSRTASRRSAGSAPRAARPAASSTPTTSGCRSGRSSRPTSSS